MTGRKVAYDLESNGLLDQLTRIHHLVVIDIETREMWSCTDDKHPEAEKGRLSGKYHPLRVGLKVLEEAALRVGHNVIRFDEPAIRKVKPKYAPKGLLRDTLVCASLTHPNDLLKASDAELIRKGKLTPALLGWNSIEAWGERLGVLKGTYGKDAKAAGEDIWAEWSPEMADYNEQDVAVTIALWEHLAARPDGPRLDASEEIPAVQLEHDVAEIIARQERRGFWFDIEAARSLHVKLVSEREAEEATVRDVFPSWWEVDGPERTYSMARRVWTQSEFGGHVIGRKKKLGPRHYQIAEERGYFQTNEEGGTYQPVKLVEFNPSSRLHVIQCFKKKYGWEPTELTEHGQPKVDDTVLQALPFPEAKKLARLFALQKLIGYIAAGKEAWVLHYNEKTQAIHGRVNSNGANTGRMTHSKPNLANIPSVRALYGKECRGLFQARPGMSLVGVDADGLELRTMAHFLARIDNGAFIEILLKGDKKLGTDQHSMNCRAIGLDPKMKYKDGKPQPGSKEELETGRDIAKTFFSNGNPGQ